MTRNPLAPIALGLACACAGLDRAEDAEVVAPVAEPAAATARPPVVEPARSGPPATDAASLAHHYFDQVLGFDALEAYTATAGTERLGFAVARKWYDGRVRIALKVEEPRALDELAILLLQNRDRSDDLFVYLTPQLFPDGGFEAFGPAGRVRRLQMAGLDFEVPFTGTRFPMGELRPFLRGELDWRRLPDAVWFGDPCYVVEGRPTRDGFAFEALELTLSKATGIALRTRYLVGGKAARTILVRPRDVQSRQGRYLPIRRQVMGAASREYELVLRNVVVDPALPDRMFSNHNLRLQRFPRF